MWPDPLLRRALSHAVRTELSVDALWYSHDGLSTDHVLKDFDSRTEAMRLKCPYGNADGINDCANV